MITTVNPATGQVIKTYKVISDSQVEAMLDSSKAAFEQWHSSTVEQRGDVMRRLGVLLERDASQIASIVSKEMGKPITSAQREVAKCAIVCEYYAAATKDYLAPVSIESDYSRSELHYSPLGVILGVMPWNFPIWQLIRFAVPTLMAGNTVVVKPAPNTMGAALALNRLFDEAGFPEGAYQTLIVKEDSIQRLIHSPKVAGVSFTGSQKVGSIIGSLAGAAIKPCVLELGGIDPYIVLEDADIELAATVSVASRMNNAGQVCIAAKRFIVLASVYEAFLERVLQLMGGYTYADPLDPDCQFGPLAREDLQLNLHRQVCDSIEQGASCLLGGVLPRSKGYYYPATVLTDVTPGMPAYEEELFGPVACVFKAQSVDEAIDIANDSPYGLSGVIFTRNEQCGHDLAANRLNVGVCHVNTVVTSNPRLPFGGIKQSGYGRELGADGVRAFCNQKTVVVK